MLGCHLFPTELRNADPASNVFYHKQISPGSLINPDFALTPLLHMHRRPARLLPQNS